MKFLHTSDWHVGKTLKGRSRLDEQKAGPAPRSSASPRRIRSTRSSSPATCTTPPRRRAEAQQPVIRTLLALARTGAEVIAIAGNHDHGAHSTPTGRLGAAGITLLGRPAPPSRGGVVELHRPQHGEPVNVAALPFLSQR